MPHPDPGDIWPDQPWNANWFGQGALTTIEDNEYVGDCELYLDIFHQYENKDHYGSEGQNFYGSNDGDDLELGYDEVTVAGLAIDERDEQLNANEDVNDINITFQLSLWTAIQDEVRRKEQDKKREEDDQCCQQSTDLIGSSISPSVSPINQIRDQISVKPIKYLN